MPLFMSKHLGLAGLACSVCFGDPNSSLTIGLRAGIIALLVILCFVLGAFGYFFWQVSQRSKKFPDSLSNGTTA